MAGDLTAVRVVLVRPKIAGNLGATARAMANMGLSDLVFVAPQPDPGDRRARQRAARAEPLLGGARIVDDLADALDGVHWTVGATCRQGRYRRAIEINPRQLADEAVDRTGRGQRVAIVFGPEDHGLERQDLLACDASLRIPSHDDYPSLNLAAAVMVCAYEIFVAATADAPPKLTKTERQDRVRTQERADAETMLRMIRKLRQGLVDIEYVRPEHPEHLVGVIRAVLGRAELSMTEARIFMGLGQQLQEFAKYGPQRE